MAACFPNNEMHPPTNSRGSAQSLEMLRVAYGEQVADIDAAMEVVGAHPTGRTLQLNPLV